jgi:hypothetical protein
MGPQRKVESVEVTEDFREGDKEQKMAGAVRVRVALRERSWQGRY